MKIRSPSMSELHAFVTVARLGSFTRAAEELCVTQAAVSRAVNRLEQHFGQPLLLRTAHALSLTAAGTDFLEMVQGPVQAIEDASTLLMSRGVKNQLTLTVVPTLAYAWLQPRLPLFTQLHPEIRLNFARYQVDEDFSRSEIDAGIIPATVGELPVNWDCDYVIGREVVPVAHPARLKARRAAGRWTTPVELMDEPLLYHSTTPERWQQWLRQAGVQDAVPKLATGFDHASILIQAVKTDMGIAVVQPCLIREELASEQLAIIFDLPFAQPKGWFLCAPTPRRGHYALSVFREWLLEIAAAERALLTKTDTV